MISPTEFFLLDCQEVRLAACFIDKDNIITKVQIDGNYYKDIYPKDINKMLERYVGEKITVTYD